MKNLSPASCLGGASEKNTINVDAADRHGKKGNQTRECTLRRVFLFFNDVSGNSYQKVVSVKRNHPMFSFQIVKSPE